MRGFCGGENGLRTTQDARQKADPEGKCGGRYGSQTGQVHGSANHDCSRIRPARFASVRNRLPHLRARPILTNASSCPEAAWEGDLIRRGRGSTETVALCRTVFCVIP